MFKLWHCLMALSVMFLLANLVVAQDVFYFSKEKPEWKETFKVNILSSVDKKPIPNAKIYIARRPGIPYKHCDTCVEPDYKYFLSFPAIFQADKSGSFNLPIESRKLSPQHFAVIVAPGYKAKTSSIGLEDRYITAEPIDSKLLTSDHLIKGKVLDKDGKPVANAVVEPDVYYDPKTKDIVSGYLDGINELAITDENGEFVIFSETKKPLLGITVRAKNYASTLYQMVDQREQHIISLTPSANLKGKVTKNGSPVANVVVSARRKENALWKDSSVGYEPVYNVYFSGESYFEGDHFALTNKDGEFEIPNLTPNKEHVLVAHLGTIQSKDYCKTAIATTGDSFATTDTGELKVEPNRKIIGKVILLNAEPIPEKSYIGVTRYLYTENTYKHAEIDKNGEFVIESAPDEELVIYIGIENHIFSQKNPNAYSDYYLLGNMSKDIKNLTILVEPRVKGEKPLYRDDSLIKQPFNSVTVE